MSSRETGSEEEPKEFFHFEYYFRYNCQKRLLEMKQDDFFQNRKPKIFTIFQPDDLNLVYRWALLEAFCYFQEKGIIWEECQIELGKNYVSLLPLLHAVNTMNIFKKLCLCYRFDVDGEDSEEHSNLLPGITSNHFTKEIKIYFTPLDTKRGHFLALNNLLQTNTPCLQKLILNFCKPFDYSWILPGLLNNRTLKELKISLNDLQDFTDADTSAIVEAVARNPNLEVLEIDGARQHFAGDLSSEALKRLLSDSTSLRELTLISYRDSRPKLNAECIIQGLKNSPSLKRLDIRNILYGDFIFSRFFRVLPDCPLIEYFSIADSSEEDLAQVKLLPRLPRPIRFDLHQSWLNNNCALEVLRHHPEVRLTCFPSDDTENADLWYFVAMNYHGRYLLDRPNVPLSIWPLVLEKVNQDFYLRDKTSILYGLLKGPAWGGRTSIERTVD